MFRDNPNENYFYDITNGDVWLVRQLNPNGDFLYVRIIWKEWKAP